MARRPAVVKQAPVCRRAGRCMLAAAAALFLWLLHPAALDFSAFAAVRKAAARAKKDPSAPKRPLSAYMRFAADVRAKNADLKATEMAQLAGKEWKALAEEAKGPYEEAYEADKKAYAALMEKYEASGAKAAWAEIAATQKGKTIKTAKAPKDPAAPKKPLTAFFCFMAKFRADHPELKGVKAAGPGGAEWSKMAATQKKVYEAESQQLKVQYEGAMKEYVSSGKQAAWEDPDWD